MSSIIARVVRRNLAQNTKNYCTRWGKVNPFPHHEANPDMWKKVFFIVGIPSVLLAMVNAYLGHQKEHDKPRPEFVPYEYMTRRTKRFPWGDGNHGLFHNPAANPLPTGYEVEDPHSHH